MNSKAHKKLFLTILAFAILFSDCSRIKYRAENQMDLHNKLNQKKMKVAVLPFTLNTPPKEKRLAFENADVALTNEFTKIIWKKNKVRIAHKDEIMEAIKTVNIHYGELNPDMKDLDLKPNIPRIVALGKKLDTDVIFTGTVRTNNYKYTGNLELDWRPPFIKIKRLYNFGAQIMAIDVNQEEVLAFDFIKNKLEICARVKRKNNNEPDKNLAKGKAKLLEKCAFALAYYAPMPEKREFRGALKAGVAILNFIGDEDFYVDCSITDDTWKLYPEGYFMENLGYTREDFEMIPK